MATQKPVLGSGPLDSPLWVVVKFPKEQDVAEGRLLSGNDGVFFRKKLELAGISPQKVRFESLLPFRPKNNDFSQFETKEELPHLLESLSSLKERIKQYQPNIVFCLGSETLKYLMGQNGNVAKWRGHIILHEECNCKMMVSYEPIACIRQRFVDGGQKPGQFETLLVNDIYKVASETTTKELVQETYETVIKPSFDQVESELQDIKKNSNLLSFDIETNHHSLVDCIGFAGSPHRAICIPLWILSVSGPVRYWGSDSEFVQTFLLIKDLLESDIPKVAQNATFDCFMLGYYYGIRVNNLVWDTMAAAHALYCDLPKDLSSLISFYTKLPYQKYLVETGQVMDRWEYNATDAIANYHVMQGEIQEMKEYGIYEHYQNVINPCILPLINMQMSGVRVDLTYLHQSLAREYQIKQDLLETLDQVFPKPFGSDAIKAKHKFNPGSWVQKQHLFYDILGCKKIYFHGKVSTDDSALEKIKERDRRKSVKLLVEACQRYSAAQAMASRLETPLVNGFLHTEYLIAGTDTGRLSSRASNIEVWSEADRKYVKAGTNLQNISKGIQRKQLIPTEDDEEFAIVDQWAAESYLTSLDAKDEFLLDMLNKGRKPYKWILEEASKRFPDEIKEAGYGYHQAKQSIHGMNYGAKPEILAKEGNLPLPVADFIYHFYHQQCPGILARQRRIEETLKKTRTLTSFLGRRRFFIAPWGQELLNCAYAWPSQSTIGELTNIALAKLWWLHQTKRVFCLPVLNTHDGLVIRSKKGQRESCKKAIIDAFNVPITAHGITIKIPLEIGWGANFNDAQDVEIHHYI